MILDLSVFRDETLDIKTADGKMLHIRKPSQRMVIEIIKTQHIDDHTPPEEVVMTLNNLAAKILNENTEGVHIDAKVVEALPEAARIAIVSAYAEFIQRLQSNPT